MERNEMNLRERWEKQNNSVKLLMKKLRRHDTFVVTVAVVIALILCGGLIYMSTPVVAASARDQVVQKENKNNEKTTEKLDELHNYLTDIDKMIVKNQKGIDSYYEKTKNDRLEGDKNTDAVSEKVSGLGTNLKDIHTSVNSTETRIESLKELIENGNGETREKAAKEFDAIGIELENIKNEYENVKKQNKELMEDLDNEIRTEVKNGDDKISTDSLTRYEELLKKLTEFDKELEKRNMDSVADLKSEFESLSEALGKEINEKIDDYNSENKAMGEALDQKIENYNSDNKAMGDALGQKIENYNSDNKAMGDALGQKIESYNSDNKAMGDALGQKIENYNSDNKAIGEALGQRIENYNSDNKAIGDALGQKIENYNSESKARGDALGQKIENYNSESKARGDKIDQRITNINTDINKNISTNMDGIKGYIDAKSAGINNKLDQVFQRVSNGKKLLASALLTKGVKIKEDATFMEFVRAIENIPAQVVIDSGDTAASIEYDYHYHKDGRGQVCGDSYVLADRYGGCYTTPVYHRHTDACYTTRNIYVISTNKDTRRRSHVKDYSDGTPVFSYECKHCGARFNNTNSWHEETVYSIEEAKERDGVIQRVNTQTIMVCNKNESYVEGYSPSCGYAHGQVVSAHIKFNGRYSGYNSTVPAINASRSLRTSNRMVTRGAAASLGGFSLSEDEMKSRLDAIKDYEEPADNDDDSGDLSDSSEASVSENVKEDVHGENEKVTQNEGAIEASFDKTEEKADSIDGNKEGTAEINAETAEKSEAAKDLNEEDASVQSSEEAEDQSENTEQSSDIALP